MKAVSAKFLNFMHRFRILHNWRNEKIAVILCISFVSFFLGRMSVDYGRLHVAHANHSTSLNSSSTQRHISVPFHLILLVLRQTDLLQMQHTLRLLDAANYTGVGRVDLSIHLFRTQGDNYDVANNNLYDYATSILDQYSWPHGILTMYRNRLNILESLLDPWNTVSITYDHVIYLDTWTQFHSTSLTWILKANQNRLLQKPYVFGSSLGATPIRGLKDFKVAGDSVFETFEPEELVDASYLPLEFYYYGIVSDTNPFTPSSRESWSTFQHWLRASKNEWNLWPNINPTTFRKDIEWKRLEASKTTHWTFWITRFIVEYNLFVLHHNFKDPTAVATTKTIAGTPAVTSVPATATAITKRNTADGNHVIDPPFFNFLGKLVRGGPISDLAKEISSLSNTIFRGDDDPSVSITVVNAAFLSTATSWLCNVDMGGFRPPGITWLALDEYTFKMLKKINGTNTIFTVLSDQIKKPHAGHKFGTNLYWVMMLRRTQLIGEILNLGVSVFAFETDQVWLEDPMPAIKNALDEGADIVGTLTSGIEIGGNFLYLRSNVATRRLWLEVTQKFEDSYKKYLNSNETDNSLTLIDNDQSLLTKEILFDHAFQKANPVLFRFLDPDRFVDGTWYNRKSSYSNRRWSKLPVLINNNYIIGAQSKIDRLKERGHWFFDESTGGCNRTQKALFKKSTTRIKENYEIKDVLDAFRRRAKAAITKIEADHGQGQKSNKPVDGFNIPKLSHEKKLNRDSFKNTSHGLPVDDSQSKERKTSEQYLTSPRRFKTTSSKVRFRTATALDSSQT